MNKKLLTCCSLLFLLFSCKKEVEVQTDPLNEGLKKEKKSSLVRDLKDEKYNFLGFGYDITKDYANENSVGNEIIDIDKFLAGSSSKTIDLPPPNFQSKYEIYGDNAWSFSQNITKRVSVSTDIPVFKKVLTAGFGSSLDVTNKFSGKHIYASENRLFLTRRLRMDVTATELTKYLKQSFIDRLKTLTPEEFVLHYGTHVLTDIYLGAKFEAVFQAETSSQFRNEAASFGLNAGMKGVFNFDTKDSTNTTDTYDSFNRRLFFYTRGGNPTATIEENVIDLEKQYSKVDVKQWQNSITLSNSVLVDFGGSRLIPIWELITDATKKAQIKNYILKYISDNQVALSHEAIPIYSYYNPKSGDHFFTPDTRTPLNYTKEGVMFYAFNYKVPSTVPIYSYYNKISGDHYLNQSSMAPINYTYEGVKFYAYPSKIGTSIPIYSYYNSKSGDHYLNPSTTTPSGYVREGIQFYAMKASK